MVPVRVKVLKRCEKQGSNKRVNRCVQEERNVNPRKVYSGIILPRGTSGQTNK